MQRIDDPTADDSNPLKLKYTEGDPGTGVPATIVRADALNAIQEELSHIVESAGGTLDAEDDTQVLAALNAIFLKLTGGTLTGFLNLHANPTSNLHAATKQYVDASVPGGAAASKNLGADIVADGSGNLLKVTKFIQALDADYTFSAAEAGNLFLSFNKTTTRNINLPQISSLPSGTRYGISNYAADINNLNIVAFAGDELLNPLPSVLRPGETLWIFCREVSIWQVESFANTSATTSVSGTVLLATAAEINTGTNATKALTASALAGSKRSPSAWVSMDAAGNIEKSFGVSSITVGGTGTRTVIFSTAMPDDLYAVAGMSAGIQVDVTYGTRTVNNCHLSINSQTTGGFNNTACSVFFFGN